MTCCIGIRVKEGLVGIAQVGVQHEAHEAGDGEDERRQDLQKTGEQGAELALTQVLGAEHRTAKSSFVR